LACQVLQRQRVDGDLSAVSQCAGAPGLNQTVPSATPAAAGGCCTYRASDGTAVSNTYRHSGDANQPRGREQHSQRTTPDSTAYTPVSINVVGNDSDPNGSLNPHGAIVAAPNKGAA
jgi:hypothetical protein